MHPAETAAEGRHFPDSGRTQEGTLDNPRDEDCELGHLQFPLPKDTPEDQGGGLKSQGDQRSTPPSAERD